MAFDPVTAALVVAMARSTAGDDEFWQTDGSRLISAADRAPEKFGRDLAGLLAAEVAAGPLALDDLYRGVAVTCAWAVAD
jgi:hypothetical protein